MRVKIGRYPVWWGPYQIAEKIMFWVPRKRDRYGFPRTADSVHNFGKWLSNTWLNDVCQWVHNRKHRTVRVHVDDYDVWGADSTLAYIIHPVLIRLKEQKHGSPDVDDEDVPEHLRSTAAPPTENNWDTDENHHKRWEWVLDEMIWAFGQVNTDWEDQFHTGEIKHKFVPIDGDGNEVPEDTKEFFAEFYRMERDEGDTHVCDYEGMRAHEERMQRGFELFGKYYRALWD